MCAYHVQEMAIARRRSLALACTFITTSAPGVLFTQAIEAGRGEIVVTVAAGRLETRPPPAARFAGFASLVLWTAVVIAGHLMSYTLF